MHSKNPNPFVLEAQRAQPHDNENVVEMGSKKLTTGSKLKQCNQEDIIDNRKVKKDDFFFLLQIIMIHNIWIHLPFHTQLEQT